MRIMPQPCVKAPAAAARKIAQASINNDPEIKIWGDGKQIRSFTYIDDCIEGTLRLMNSNYSEPINIGSSEAVTIQELYDIAARFAKIENVHYSYDLEAPQGVRGRSSDNAKCIAELGWAPTIDLNDGMAKTYEWVYAQIKNDI